MRLSYISASLTLGCVLLLVTACGGGSPTVETTPISIVMESQGYMDGIVTSNGNAWNDAVGVGVGDADCHENGLGIRMVYCFMLTELPAGAQIDRAVMHVYQEAVPHANPFGTLGRLVVDHVDTGAGLTGDDYDGGTLLHDVGVLSSNTICEWKSADVTTAVRDSVTEGRSHVDLRVQFENLDSDGDGECDCICLNDGEDTLESGHIPVLEIIYRAP